MRRIVKAFCFAVPLLLLTSVCAPRRAQAGPVGQVVESISQWFSSLFGGGKQADEAKPAGGVEPAFGSEGKGRSEEGRGSNSAADRDRRFAGGRESGEKGAGGREAVGKESAQGTGGLPERVAGKDPGDRGDDRSMRLQTGGTDEKAGLDRWKDSSPGKGGRFGKAQEKVGGIQAAAQGLAALPSFMAGRVCPPNDQACLRSGGQKAAASMTGTPNLASLLTKADLPAGFEEALRAAQGRAQTAKDPAPMPAQPAASQTPKARPPAEVPPVEPAEPAEKSWFEKAGDWVSGVWDGAKSKVAQTVDAVQTTLKDDVLRYDIGMAVVRPLDFITPDQSLPGKLADRARLELLKPAIQALADRARGGDADAQKKLNEIYASDVKRDDWQPFAEQFKAKELALDIGRDKEIREARNNWAQLSDQQREAALQKTADYAAAELGLPASNLNYKAIACGQAGCTLGYFSPSDGSVVINSNNLGNFDQVANTVIHETTHRYQQQLTDNPAPNAGFSLDANANDQWAILTANEGYYISYDSNNPNRPNHAFNDYANQPMEKHSRQTGGDAVREATYVFTALNAVDAVTGAVGNAVAAAGQFASGLFKGK